MVTAMIYDRMHVVGIENLDAENKQIIDDDGFVVVLNSGLGNGKMDFIKRVDFLNCFLPNVSYEFYMGVTDDNEAYISDTLKTAGIHYSIMDRSEGSSKN